MAKNNYCDQFWEWAKIQGLNLDYEENTDDNYCYTCQITQMAFRAWKESWIKSQDNTRQIRRKLANKKVKKNGVK